MPKLKLVKPTVSGDGLNIKQLVFFVIDVIAGVIVQLFTAQNHADAKRAYLNMLSKTPNVNPNDFRLGEVGNINDNVELLDLSKIDYDVTPLAPLTEEV